MSKVTEGGVGTLRNQTGHPDSNSALALTQKESVANPQVFDIFPFSVSSFALNACASRKGEPKAWGEDFPPPYI